MICADCGKSIPGFEKHVDVVDVCDKCLLIRLKDDERIKSLMPTGKSVNDMSYDEAGEILDKAGSIDYSIDNWIVTRVLTK